MKKFIFYLLIIILTLISTQVFAFSVNSPYAILIDANTGRVIYEKNASDKTFPASTTKILSAILVLENCDLSEEVTASYAAVMSIPSGASHAEIRVGETFTVEDLLTASLIQSANDATNILAEYVGGSIDSFVSMMNTRAKELGLTNSNFVNPHGLHDSNHYSSASDLAKLYRYASCEMSNKDVFNEIVSTVRFKLPATSIYSHDTYFTNTNQLIVPNNSSSSKNYYYKYATGGKTGYTSQAKNCLVASATKDGVNLIAVVLGAIIPSLLVYIFLFLGRFSLVLILVIYFLTLPIAVLSSLFSGITSVFVSLILILEIHTYPLFHNLVNS